MMIKISLQPLLTKHENKFAKAEVISSESPSTIACRPFLVILWIIFRRKSARLCGLAVG